MPLLFSHGRLDMRKGVKPLNNLSVLLQVFFGDLDIWFKLSFKLNWRKVKKGRALSRT